MLSSRRKHEPTEIGFPEILLAIFRSWSGKPVCFRFVKKDADPPTIICARSSEHRNRQVSMSLLIVAQSLCPGIGLLLAKYRAPDGRPGLLAVHRSIKALLALLLLASVGAWLPVAAGGEVLHNAIRLPETWPPQLINTARNPSAPETAVSEAYHAPKTQFIPSPWLSLSRGHGVHVCASQIETKANPAPG